MGWPEKPEKVFTPNCKIKILDHLAGLFPEYQPEVGKVYDAEYAERSKKYNIAEFCLISIKDKLICVRHGEFEIVG